LKLQADTTNKAATDNDKTEQNVVSILRRGLSSTMDCRKSAGVMYTLPSYSIDAKFRNVISRSRAPNDLVG